MTVLAQDFFSFSSEVGGTKGRVPSITFQFVEGLVGFSGRTVVGIVWFSDAKFVGQLHLKVNAKFIGGFSGDIVDAEGYVFFFIYSGLLGVPAILLILYLMKQNGKMLQKG